jgi:hypothetical protein
VRVRLVGGLLAVVLVGQAFVVTSRLSDEAVSGEALGPGTERVVSDRLLSEGRVVRATVTRDEFRPPAHALYGEAGRGDPLAGRMLAVGSGFHDNVPVFPTVKTPGFRAVDLGGRKGAVGRDRAWTWVTWDLPDCTDECQGYTVGRNLSEGEVLAAARGATADTSAPAIAAAALPAGMSLLLTERLDLDGFLSPGGQFVSWQDGDRGVVVRVAPDARLAPLLRFWVDGPPTRVRSQTGSAGSVARVGLAGDRYRGRAWSEGGRSLLVLSVGLSSAELDRFVAGLRAAGAGEWEMLRSRVLDISSQMAIAGCDDREQAYTAIGRHEGRYRWAVGLKVGARDQFSTCETIVTPDRRSLSSGGSSRPPGPLSVSTSGIGGATDPIGLFVMGIAPPGTARVRAEVAGGRTVDAELADTGPRPGERYYAVFVEGDIRRKPTMVATDSGGTELARVVGGAPT